MKTVYEALIQMVFKEVSVVDNVHSDFFPQAEAGNLMAYRNSVRRRIHEKFNLIFYCSLEYVSGVKGKYWWLNNIENIINSNFINDQNLFEVSKEVIAKLKEMPVWLIELASHELNLRELYFKPPPSLVGLNTSLSLCMYSYDIPAWYKHWLDTDLGKKVTSRRKALFYHPDSSTPTPMVPQEPSFNLIPPEKLNLKSQDKIYVAFFKNRKGKPSVLQLDEKVYNLLTSCCKNELSLDRAFRLAESTELSISDFKEQLKKHELFYK